jgi:nucleoid DNA-binding protein
MGTLTKRGLVVKISQETLAEGGSVELRNFGTLEVKLANPRVGRNPSQPGSRYVIPARAIVKFMPGAVLRRKVDKLTAAMVRGNSGAKQAATMRLCTDR